LAYRLYQDATRASRLVALDDAPHPLFMPLSGCALAA
jgi:prophage DNA circulation protein